MKKGRQDRIAETLTFRVSPKTLWVFYVVNAKMIIFAFKLKHLIQ